MELLLLSRNSRFVKILTSQDAEMFSFIPIFLLHPFPLMNHLHPPHQRLSELQVEVTQEEPPLI